MVAGVATACTFPPAEPGAPALLTVDNWVAGRSKIWDIAVPQPAGCRRSTPRTTPGIVFARVSDDETARPLGRVSQFDGTFDNTGEGGLMGIAA